MAMNNKSLKYKIEKRISELAELKISLEKIFFNKLPSEDMYNFKRLVATNSSITELIKLLGEEELEDYYSYFPVNKENEYLKERF
jgi:ABC-type hemin transport system substrate-binding protein